MKSIRILNQAKEKFLQQVKRIFINQMKVIERKVGINKYELDLNRNFGERDIFKILFQYNTKQMI